MHVQSASRYRIYQPRTHAQVVNTSEFAEEYFVGKLILSYGTHVVGKLIVNYGTHYRSKRNAKTFDRQKTQETRYSTGSF